MRTHCSSAVLLCHSFCIFASLDPHLRAFKQSSNVSETSSQGYSSGINHVCHWGKDSVFKYIRGEIFLETIGREQQGFECAFLKEPNFKCQELSPSACCVQDFFSPPVCYLCWWKTISWHILKAEESKSQQQCPCSNTTSWFPSGYFANSGNIFVDADLSFMGCTDGWCVVCSVHTPELWCSGVGQPMTQGASESACCQRRDPFRCQTDHPGETERKYF